MIMAKKRATYHHGDLRAALIQAADQIVAKTGVENFSLRLVAKRAGVSPSAPAHHFCNVSGLLTEIAILSFERLNKRLQEIQRSDDPVAYIRALGVAAVSFAVEHPGHYRLMFRHDLVNLEDTRYVKVSTSTGETLARAIAVYHGRAKVDFDQFEDAADFFTTMATLHGLAFYILDGKVKWIFPNETRESFIKKKLPRLIERLFPDIRRTKKVVSLKKRP